MRIGQVEPIACDLGWRTISFLKITTDDGIVGWSEYSESFGNQGLGSVISSLTPYVLGQDPLLIERLTCDLSALVRPARGAMNRQAIAAIENALLDIKGKALGVPVAGLLGGTVRDRVPVYWSHCGTYRVGRYVEYLGVGALHTYEDVVLLGKLVRERGFTAMKTNITGLDDLEVQSRSNPYARAAQTTGRSFDNRMIAEAEKMMAAMRQGAGDDADIFFDINFCLELEGYSRLERALAPYRPAWLEIDTFDAEGLASVRRGGTTPIGSGEALYERAGYRPFFEAQAFDVAIVDVLWNGWLESVKIAAQAEAYSVAVAPHNFYGHLASAISASFASAVPNLHIMEIDVDGATWRDELTTPPVIEDGHLILSDAPGWGVEVNEEAIRRHAPSTRSEVPWR
ncbi:mandelate racemase/muconate lactonizing enzyme family protein [uncultured Friedmanniella sp.]|uniref:mandelate racemase/muconate lactonizing enzyme family protein n=1 Tax=uncultured Friedmanniella sp. TaxID=335381 RepID=UPI0035C9D0C9